MHYLYTDGGSRGNPGNSAIAYFLFDEANTLVDFGGKFIGTGTNNNAEYLALIEGLKLAKKNYIKELLVNMDSELVVNQVNKKFKVNSPDIKKLYTKVEEEMNKFDKINIAYVPREKNKLADKMVNIVLDSVQTVQ